MSVLPLQGGVRVRRAISSDLRGSIRVSARCGTSVVDPWPNSRRGRILPRSQRAPLSVASSRAAWRGDGVLGDGWCGPALPSAPNRDSAAPFCAAPPRLAWAMRTAGLMRIVFVGHSAGMLGAERSMFDIRSGAVRTGMSTVVLPSEGPLAPRWRPGAPRSLFIPFGHGWGHGTGSRRWSGPRLQALELRKASRHRAAASSPTSSSPIRPSSLPERRRRRLGYPSRMDRSRVPAGQSSAPTFLPKRWIARESSAGLLRCARSRPYVDEQIGELASTHHSRPFTVSPNPASGALADCYQRHRRRSQIFLLPGFFSREKGQHLVVWAPSWLSRSNDPC